jgi:hypothetical protein
VTKSKTAGYEDEDLKSIKSEIDEALRLERVAKTKAAEKRKKDVQAAWNRAAKLGIPVADAKRALKLLRLQEQLDEAAGSLPDESAEVVADMVKALGEFGDTPLGGAAIAAVDKRVTAAPAVHEAEQADGDRILEGAVH